MKIAVTQFFLALFVYSLAGCGPADEPLAPDDQALALQERQAPPAGEALPPPPGHQAGEELVRATVVNGRQEVTIHIESSGFKPVGISVQAGLPTELTFVRTDPEACASEIDIPALDVSIPPLPLNEPVTTRLVASRPGVYMFICGLDTPRGRILVK